MRNAPSNTDDVIDSRDVIARIKELEGERNLHSSPCARCVESGEVKGKECPECNGTGEREDGTAWAVECPDDAAELAALTKLAEEAEGYADDWKCGVTLIRDHYFKSYAQELADELAETHERPRKGRDPVTCWPYTCIDWDQAARELQYDYTAVDFDGVAYWVR